VVFKPEERLSATKALTHPALGKSGIMSSLTDVASELGKVRPKPQSHLEPIPYRCRGVYLSATAPGVLTGG
jgi:hypothetical protein